MILSRLERSREMSEDLGQALQEWYNEVANLANLETKEQQQITQAGAKVFADELQKVTPVSNRNSKHAKDSIITQNKNVDNQVDGSSTVGYSEDKGFIMRFMNDGTKFYPKKKNHLGFYNKLLENPAVINRVLDAEAKAYTQIINNKNKGGD